MMVNVSSVYGSGFLKGSAIHHIKNGPVTVSMPAYLRLSLEKGWKYNQYYTDCKIGYGIEGRQQY